MRALVLAATVALCGSVQAAPASLADILAASPQSDWRPIDPARLLAMRLPAGEVLIELAPGFAPNHVANILALVHERYFDGLAIVRVQDNYVVQWADPAEQRNVGRAAKTLKAEFDRPIAGAPAFTPLPDPDTYAPQTGFSDGFPAARDPASGRTWLVHCYGMVGAGRDNDADSGGGTELYAVIGQAPRQLDRNVTLLGRVVRGIELLSSLPRGTRELGFYETARERTPIVAIRVAADLPEAERPRLEALRVGSPLWAAFLRNRRFRQDDWYKHPAGRIDVCNLSIPVRDAAKGRK